MGQKSGHGLAEFSAQGLGMMKSRFWQDSNFLWKLKWGGICFQVHSGCWQNSSYFWCMSVGPGLLLAGGWCLLSCLIHELPHHGCLVHQPSKEKLAICQERILPNITNTECYFITVRSFKLQAWKCATYTE